MIGRLWRVYRVAGEQRLDTLVPENRRGPFVRLITGLNPFKRRGDLPPRGERLRLALEDLGPVFIKFGQLLSTRRDLLPDDIADELALLQDQVPPFATGEAIREIETSLGSAVTTLFARFDHEPLAAASVAQVHSAELHCGESVVVKVLRPNIGRVIADDLRVIKTLALIVEWLSRDGWRLRAREVARDYERTILDELDLRREAANASQLRRNFIDSGLVYVPEVHWPLTTQNVMVSERISGIPVTDVETLRDANVDMALLAERGVEIFFTQVFRDSFFHADMHPGNIFVDISDPADPRYIAVDCAIVGQLEQNDLYYLARNLLAIFQQDYRLVARLHVECGWVPPETPVAEFESAMRTLCEPVFERPLGEISFGHMLVTLFRTASRFDMTVQPQLVLLQKTLLNIEGLGRQLYPELSLWDTAQPFLERWLEERYAPSSVLRRLQSEAPGWLEALPLVPDLVLARLRDPATPDRTEKGYRRPLTIALGIVTVTWGLAVTPLQPALVTIGVAVIVIQTLGRH